MAYPNATYGYHPASSEMISRRRPSHPFDGDDDPAVLDPNILDTESMQSPADAQNRKVSFVNANGVLTPVETQGWNPAYGGLPVEPSSTRPPHPFHDDHNGFPARPPPHISAYGHPPHPESWSYEQGSGHCTPTNVTDLEYIHHHHQQHPPPGYEHAPYIHHRNDSARGSFSHPGPAAQHPPQHFNPPPPDGTFAPAPQVQTPMSPHSNQDWMAMAQHEAEAARMSKRMRSGSPARTSVDLQRRDGIRKKNGRIDIPHERNIQTIDELIENATDDEQLKELKQQKRLLRNREAALASRQRKKKHTEDLETREKNFNQNITSLEARMNGMAIELRNRETSYNIVVHQLQEAKRQNEIMHDEKRDMILKHTEETATLRKRIQILTEQLDAGPAPMMSAQPSSTGFNDFTGEMEALTMAPPDWDHFDFFNDLNSNVTDEFTFDPKPETTTPHMLDKRNSPASAVTASDKKATDGSSDPPFASGLLFFLLLCGAFVASRPESSRPSYIPQVPEDVQAAAPALIHNLLSDSNSTPTQQQGSGSRRTQMEPGPSAIPQAGRSHNRLDHMHHHITSPTKEQEAAAAFSLTTQQYASISGMDYISQNERSRPNSRHNSPPGRRRNVAEALANMQDEQSRNNKAEVYTRSLLWDQIPPEVLQQFKQMARDHSEIETRQSQTRNDYQFKTEP